MIPMLLYQNYNSIYLTASNNEMKNRIFGLDPQFIADSAILALSIFVLFLFLSYLLFNPVRQVLEKRKEKVKEELVTSSEEKEKAIQLRKHYEEKLNNAQVEVDKILSDARKKAIIRQEEIISEAKLEVSRLMERANKEIFLEKSKAKDEVKNEIITVASYMAGKIIEVSIDQQMQSKLIEDAIKEIGETTWLS